MEETPNTCARSFLQKPTERLQILLKGTRYQSDCRCNTERTVPLPSRSLLLVGIHRSILVLAFPSYLPPTCWEGSVRGGKPGAKGVWVPRTPYEAPPYHVPPMVTAALYRTSTVVPRTMYEGSAS